MCVFWLNNNWYYSYGYIRRTTRVQYHIECTRRVCTCELCSASTGILVSVLPARRHLKNSTSSSAAAAVAPTTTSPRNQTETDYFVLKTQIIIFFSVSYVYMADMPFSLICDTHFVQKLKPNRNSCHSLGMLILMKPNLFILWFYIDRSLLSFALHCNHALVAPWVCVCELSAIV